MKIAFICTGNSARSQMAEGFAKRLAQTLGLNLQVYSAGSNPAEEVNPLAIKVMEERGIDISSQRPKGIEAIPYQELDVVVTLCDSARQTCPILPGAEMVHWDLPDPASHRGTEEERLEFFRRIRDEIEERVWDMVQSLQIRKGNSAKLR
ncbi:MAG: arsenate reductase ArsC [Aquificaceae bacterium]|nr:arsenate reductase ArsC [Aquificaceae bacterium]MDW8032415.1 arsenate reductase ArsC [Aquificaceae bacterium]MDW8424161.1 arsenate reductase ArsC [Aquificaceae bacterium]